ncbi:MAG: hypothetical protein ACM3TR_11495 [Caulobacteraceae bacterium]
MDTFKLTKAIMIDGKEVNELPYNFEDMTARDKLNASKKLKNDGNIISIEETDPDYHLYLFAEAVAKADSKIDTADVLRMSAKDAQRAAVKARSFFYLSSEDLSE